MKLKDLCRKMALHGNKETLITGMTEDSRKVAPGFLFFAKKETFIQEAVSAGARAIVTDLYNPFVDVAQIVVPNVAAVMGSLASRYYGDPSSKLHVVGVTGSKGKTTTTYLVRHVLESCGLLGGVETIIPSKRFASTFTTHDVIFNHKMLSEMVQTGCKAVAIEVSSHGLVQGRVDAIAFDVGVFTNLYPDHLDYHGTIQNYIMAKQKLFERVERMILCNADDPHASFMKGSARTLSFGVQQGDIRAQDLVCHEEGIAFTIDGVRFHSHLRGKFNVYNLLAATAVGLDAGMNLSAIAEHLQTFAGVPGRLERVPNPRGIHVFVDYAHTGEALASVLAALKESSQGRLIVVFGAGGNRDPNRRKTMGHAAGTYADLAVVTTDNPRKEDPQMICREILSGFRSLDRTVVEMDRKEAIRKALLLARKGDTVLIAGKGHEKVQIFAHQTIPFDDVLVVKEFFMT